MFSICPCKYDVGLIVIIVLVFIVIIAVLFSQRVEPMAPLDFGTFKNDYPVGRCVKGSLERSPCMIGNCPIGTNITNSQYCDIDCAQISDPVTKTKCTKKCISMMKKCNEPM